MTVTEEFAWRRPGAFVFGKGFDSINYDGSITLRALHAAPFAAREIVGHFADPIWLDVQTFQVIYNNISGSPFAQKAAIAEPGGMCGQRRQSIVRLFERDTLFITNHPADEICGERATGKELGMRTTVGNTRERKHRVVDNFGVKVRVELRLWLHEPSFQIRSEREIDHHVHWMPTFFHADLPERLADVLLQLRLVFDPRNNQLDQSSADARRVLVQCVH